MLIHPNVVSGFLYSLYSVFDSFDVDHSFPHDLSHHLILSSTHVQCQIVSFRLNTLLLSNIMSNNVYVRHSFGVMHHTLSFSYRFSCLMPSASHPFNRLSQLPYRIKDTTEELITSTIFFPFNFDLRIFFVLRKYSFWINTFICCCIIWSIF